MRNNKVFLPVLSVAFCAAFLTQAHARDSLNTLPSVVVVADSAKGDGQVDGYKTGSSSTSTRTDTLLLDTPQSVSVVTQDQMDDQNITSMEEAARYVPGVDVQMGEGHRDQVTIRGMTNGKNGTTSNFFVDGARDDAEYIRDFYNTERIEFLKGPNAMAFGRGSPGGAINRVIKSADGTQKRKLVLTGGSFNNRRIEADLGDKVNDKLSLRLNTMYQKSDSYRDHIGFERFGIAPTATIALGEYTDLKVGYEHFEDNRSVDRGVPSQNGVIYQTNNSSFFGDPAQNRANTQINSVYGILTHDFDATLSLRNNMRYTNNHKFYRNSNPGAISGNTFALTAYQAKTTRDNFTNQTDLTKKFTTGSVKHKALIGTEITAQRSTKVKMNGIFGSTGTTSSTVSLSNPVSSDSVTYSSVANDSQSNVKVLAGYVQDQADINEYVQLTGGLRVDRFEINFKNRANDQDFSRIDTMLSPRAGVVIKPKKSLSLYGSYGVTYTPSAGDQFNSLSVTTKTLKPERFRSYEAGVKWDANKSLNLTAAIYQLERTNTPANDPAGSGDTVLTGESRTRGIELAANGKVTDQWQVIAAYAFQKAEITNATTQYAKGSKVALVPHNTFSLWNKYDITSDWSAGLGIISQSSQYADASNTVRLKGFTRFDAALYYNISPKHRLQVNVENITNRGYARTAHNANNILPGSPRAVNVSLITNF